MHIGHVSKNGTRRTRYKLDHEVFVQEIQVEKGAIEKRGVEMADEDNPYHIGAPFDADLWLVHKKVSDNVEAGEEILNLALMKVEYGVTSPVEGVVKRVLVFADYNQQEGMQALYGTLKESEGRFKFDPILPDEYKNAASLGPMMEILLEMTRRIDEKSSG